MNIFVLDANPKLAAQYQHDVHIRKMGTESAQILSTVLLRANYSAPYKKVNPENHPAILWTEKTSGNFEWVLEHGIEICCEFERRFGHQHKAFLALEKIKKSPYRPKNNDLTSFGQFIPEKYRQTSATEAYRDVYSNEKIVFGFYSNPAIPPIWLWERLLKVWRPEVGKIIDQKIKISPNFLESLTSFLADQLVSGAKNLPLSTLYLKFGFGDALDFPLQARKPGVLLSISEKRFYQFQFLIAFLCRENFLSGWELITGKNVRLVFKKKR